MFKIDIWKFCIVIQTKRPFLVKKWCFVNRGNGKWNLHLFPIHIHKED